MCHTLLHKMSDVWQRVWMLLRSRRKALLWFAALLLLNAGCHAAMRPKPEIAAIPEPISTRYTGALQCIGRMIDRYYGRRQFHLIVAVEPAIDATRGPVSGRDEVQAVFTLMLLTAFNEIHPGLTVSKMTPNGPEVAGPITPHLVVVATISSYDRAIIYKGKAIDLSIIGISPTLEDVEGKYEVHYAISQVSIDLIPFNVPGLESSPMVHSKLQAFLQHSSREANVGVALYIFGLGVSVIEKRVEGVGAALRMLVDLGITQMLGRSLRLPWTRCLDKPIEDKLLEELILDDFSKKSAQQQAMLIRELIREWGASVPPRGPWNATVEARLAEIRRQHNLQWPRGNKGEAYRQLYLNMPLTPPPR